MYVPRGNKTNHNTIPFVGLKPLQSQVTLVDESIVIDRWRFVRTVSGVMTRLRYFTFKADKLQAVGGVVQV